MNRLSFEKSPYLLQHAGNPVDWYPWGEEAFEAARGADKPVFLSVGYSTCHWCHVMAHESFEDPRVAAILNEHFVSIKVDREERPDVDRVYMAFVQATAGGGGWPMSVWLLPDRRPFYGGTYFPPTSQWGRPGFSDLLTELARLWREERSRVERAAAGAIESLAVAVASAVGKEVPGVAALDEARSHLLASHDRRHGGFGGAPKFPRPSELLFLLREHRRTGDRTALDAVAHTLRAMAEGGVHDQVGGGFHRYSVDRQWRVPHFEKMLYDQAQIVIACLEAAQATGDASLLDVAGDTLAYVQREMTDEGGGFYSAEDADSVPAGAAAHAHASEGAFYLWTASEVERWLGPDARLFCERYGVRAEGNALSDPHGEFTGRNILYEARMVEAVAVDAGQTVGQVKAALQRSRDFLRRVRAERPRPRRDDKILTAWNGLMIAAFARASRVCAAAVYLSSARRAATFIRSRLWDPATRRLFRRFRAGEAGIGAYAEDYACLVFGLLELFQADGDPGWLAWALELQRRQDELFWDADAGGWFNTTGEDATVLLRLKEDYDGAEPAASSLSVCNLLVLLHLGALPGEVTSRIERTFGAFAPRLTDTPRAVPLMLAALSTWHARMSEVVVVGPREGAATADLLREVERSHQPFVTLVRVDPESEEGPRLANLIPWVAGYAMRDGRPTAYVCRDFACNQPVTEPADLAARLRQT